MLSSTTGRSLNESGHKMDAPAVVGTGKKREKGEPVAPSYPPKC